MMPPSSALEAGNILLRPLTEEDLPKLLELTQDESLWKYFTADLRKMEELQKWTKPAFAGERNQYVLIHKESGNYMGSTGFGNYSARDSRIEIGWTWIAKPYQGLGFNWHMKYCMVAHAFENLAIQRVEVKTAVRNLAARKALVNFGFVEEGVLRSHTLLCTGIRRDTIYYSLLKAEWPGFKDHYLRNS